MPSKLAIPLRRTCVRTISSHRSRRAICRGYCGQSKSILSLWHLTPIISSLVSLTRLSLAKMHCSSSSLSSFRRSISSISCSSLSASCVCLAMKSLIYALTAGAFRLLAVRLLTRLLQCLWSCLFNAADDGMQIVPLLSPALSSASGILLCYSLASFFAERSCEVFTAIFVWQEFFGLLRKAEQP